MKAHWPRPAPAPGGPAAASPQDRPPHLVHARGPVYTQHVQKATTLAAGSSLCLLTPVHLAAWVSLHLGSRLQPSLVGGEGPLGDQAEAGMSPRPLSLSLGSNVPLPRGCHLPDHRARKWWSAPGIGAPTALQPQSLGSHWRSWLGPRQKGHPVLVTELGQVALVTRPVTSCWYPSHLGVGLPLSSSPWTLYGPGQAHTCWTPAWTPLGSSQGSAPPVLTWVPAAPHADRKACVTSSLFTWRACSERRSALKMPLLLLPDMGTTPMAPPSGFWAPVAGRSSPDPYPPSITSAATHHGPQNPLPLHPLLLEPEEGSKQGKKPWGAAVSELSLHTPPPSPAPGCLQGPSLPTGDEPVPSLAQQGDRAGPERGPPAPVDAVEP